MKKLMEDIASWHTKTFDTTREAQVLKLAEEVKEVHATTSNEDWYKEMADVCFVLAALIYRYNDETSKAIFFTLWAILREDDKRTIKHELKLKFEKNKKRVWIKQPDGTYHHAPGTD